MSKWELSDSFLFRDLFKRVSFLFKGLHLHFSRLVGVKLSSVTVYVCHPRCYWNFHNWFWINDFFSNAYELKQRVMFLSPCLFDWDITVSGLPRA